MTEQIDENIFAIPYPNRDNSYIVVTRLDEPYGEGSDPVISIGCTLKGNVSDPTWKVHVPQDMIKDVVMAIDFAMDDPEGL